VDPEKEQSEPALIVVTEVSVHVVGRVIEEGKVMIIQGFVVALTIRSWVGLNVKVIVEVC
jgi:hypothetical protein